MPIDFVSKIELAPKWKRRLAASNPTYTSVMKRRGFEARDSAFFFDEADLVLYTRVRERKYRIRRSQETMNRTYWHSVIFE